MVSDPLALKRGYRRPDLEQVGMIAHLPQLHQHVYDAQQVSAGQGLPCSKKYCIKRS